MRRLWEYIVELYGLDVLVQKINGVGGIMQNSFKFEIPAYIEKSEDGSYKIGGIASTEHLDKQQEILIQKGMDLSPIDSGKGFFNFDHSNKPEDIIGAVDGYRHTSDGLYIHGNLFKGHKRAEAVYTIMKALGEKKRGAVGFSVEGQIIERDTKNSKIIRKCRIKNVALTLNPVNSNTYATLVKSMTASEEVEFDATEENIPQSNSEVSVKNEVPVFTATQVIELMEKALTVGAATANQAPANLSGGDALAQEDFDRKLAIVDDKKKPRKKLSKKIYKSSMIDILNKIQELYPNHSRTEVWEAIRDRMNHKFPEIQD